MTKKLPSAWQAGAFCSTRFSFENNGLEQARDLTGLVHVDLLGGGDFGQAGHGHNVTGKGYYETCAGRYFYGTYGYYKTGGCA